MFNDFMDIGVLTTFAGLTGSVMLIVQFTKFIIKKRLGDSFVRLYSFLIALILTFVFARQGEGIEGIILTVLNAILITIASAGGYEMITDPLAKK
ncbi:MAG: hypothetical protein PHT02_06850 [Tissierellia bacterium]|nr:hypothetical protein [Tissierellia bacterium]